LSELHYYEKMKRIYLLFALLLYAFSGYAYDTLRNKSLINKAQQLDETTFFRYLKVGDGTPFLDKGYYALYEKLLENTNKNSSVTTYVFVVDHIPIDFGDKNADPETIRYILSGSARKPKDQVSAQLAGEVKNLTQKIFKETSEKMKASFRSPAVFCWVINYRAYVNKKTSHWFTSFYSTIENTTPPNNLLLDQYKNLLTREINGQLNPNNARLETESRGTRGLSYKLDALMNSISKVNSQYNTGKNFLSELATVTDVKEIANRLSTVDPSFFSLLTLDQRLKFITMFAYKRLSNSQEKICIDLLETTPQSDIDKLLSALTEKNTNTGGSGERLIIALIDRTDDSDLFTGLIGDDNYLRLVQVLTKLVINSSYFDGSKIDNAPIIIWDKSYLLKIFSQPPPGTNKYDVEFGFDSRISVQMYQTELNCAEYTPIQSPEDFNPVQPYVSCNTAWKVMDNKYVLGIFDPVIFINRSDLPLVQTAAAKNTAIVVPAIILKYSSDKRFNEDAKKLFETGIDLVTLPLPFTKIPKLATAAQRIYYAIDVAGSINSGTKLILTTTTVDENEKLKKLAETYDKVMAIIGGAQLIGKLAIGDAKIFIAKTNDVDKAVRDLANAGNIDAQRILKLRDELTHQLKAQNVVLENIAALNALTISLKKLDQASSSIRIPWKGLTTEASQFANKTGNTLYDIVIDNLGKKYYVKFDISDGKILIGDFDGNLRAFSIAEGSGELRVSLLNIKSDGEFNTKLAEYLNNRTNSLINAVTELKILKGVRLEDFAKTVPKLTPQQTQQAFRLWGEEKWNELYLLFNPKNGIPLNDGWPPFNGVKSINRVESSKDLSGKTFDRFQNEPNLGGSYASPVYSSEGVGELVFTYDSRALKGSIKEGTHYIKFKLKDNIPSDLKFEYGEAIPWFQVAGNADQIKSTINFKELIKGVHYEIIETLRYSSGKWVKIE
jgi:hypothetical protein